MSLLWFCCVKSLKIDTHTNTKLNLLIGKKNNIIDPTAPPTDKETICPARVYLHIIIKALRRNQSSLNLSIFYHISHSGEQKHLFYIFCTRHQVIYIVCECVSLCVCACVCHMSTQRVAQPQSTLLCLKFALTSHMTSSRPTHKRCQMIDHFVKLSPTFSQ